MATTAVQILSPRIPIGYFDNGAQRVKVYPTRELLSFFEQLVVRTGGDAPDVDLIVPEPEVMAPVAGGFDLAALVGADVFAMPATPAPVDLPDVTIQISMAELSQIIASEVQMALAQRSQESGDDGLLVQGVSAPDSPIAYEMTMGQSDD